MRGRKRIISLIAVLSVILVFSGVFASGVIDVSKLSLLGGGEVQPLQTANVFVDPNKIIKDYLNNPGYQVGNKFTLNINISGVSDLFAWNVNVTWVPGVLNFSKVAVYGTFLRATGSPNGTSGWINRDSTKNVTITYVNYTRGYVSIAETILGNVAGVSGSGRLVTIEFQVVGYGNSTIVISTLSTGRLPTKLLNSAVPPVAITFTKTDGYFKNKLNGDANGDRSVGSLDEGKLNAHWYAGPGLPTGTFGYSRDVDTNDDGYISSLDEGVLNANWFRSC